MDDDVTVVPLNDSQGRFVTPPATMLGGSKFRRKPIISTDSSSPLKPTTNNPSESQDTFDSQQTLPSVSLYESQQSLPSPPRQPSPPTEVPAQSLVRETVTARTSDGKYITISKKPLWKKIQARQEKQATSKAQKEAYYGIDIHRLLDRIENDTLQSSLPRYLLK
jgi:hypothetical protein